LVIDEGGMNIPVRTTEQWLKKREELKKQAQHWITGTVPPPPDHLKVEVLEERESPPDQRTY
jgi:hypothetical protein